MSVRTRIASLILHRRAHSSPPQTLTIARPIKDVLEFCQDSENLTKAFEGVATVTASGSHQFRWQFADVPGREWTTTMSTRPDSVEFAAANGQLKLAIACHEGAFGTEVTMTATSPIPGRLAAAGLFRALYRARAVLQTGEAPTLQGTADARSSQEVA